jgi:hypothetical protein
MGQLKLIARNIYSTNEFSFFRLDNTLGVTHNQTNNITTLRAVLFSGTAIVVIKITLVLRCCIRVIVQEGGTLGLLLDLLMFLLPYNLGTGTYDLSCYYLML